MDRSVGGGGSNPIPLAREGVHEKVIEYLASRGPGTVLDIPAGEGALAAALQGRGFTVCCCDIDPSQFKVEGISIVQGNLNGRIPYDDDRFDYVCFLEAIEHTENPYNAVREVARVLKPGGTLIMSTPNYLNIERRLKFLVNGYFTKPVSRKFFQEFHHSVTHGMHLSPIGYTLVRFALEQAGLTIDAIAYDRKKPKQAFLKPLVWAIRLYGAFRPKKERVRLWHDELTGPVILEGGNTLIIIARKP